MPVMIIEHTPDGLMVEEHQTYREMMTAIRTRTKIYPAALLYKARKGKLIIFEGKRRAAEHIVQSILDEEA